MVSMTESEKLLLKCCQNLMPTLKKHMNNIL